MAKSWEEIRKEREEKVRSFSNPIQNNANKMRSQGFLVANPKPQQRKWEDIRKDRGYIEPEPEPTDYWKEQPVRALGKNINAGFNMLPRGMVGIADATVGGLGIKPVNKVLDSYKDYYKKADEELAMLNQGHEFAGGVAQGIGQAIPTMALALMNPAAAAGNALTTAKGTQLVANAASLANPTTLNAARTVALQLKSNPTLYSSMVTSVGNQYLQGLNEGASREEAIKSAIIGGVPSGLIEVSGGIENLANIMANKTKGLVGVALQAAIEEGFEEIVQYPIENIGQKVAYEKDMPLFSMKEQAVINPKEMAFSGAVGATVGGLMGGGAAGVNTALYKSYAKQLDTMYKNTINNLPEDSPILERVKLMQDDNVNIDDNTKVWVINSAREGGMEFESETDKLLQKDRQKETFFPNDNNARGQTVEQGQNIVKTQNIASQAVNPVLSAFNIQNINNAREVKQNVYEFYKNSIISDSNTSKPILNKSSGMNVEVSRATINQTFQADEKYAMNQDNEIKVAAMANVVDLIQNGEFNVIDNSENPSSKKTYANITGTVNVNGTPYEITMDVRRTDNGKKLFVHSLSTNYQQVSGKKSGVVYNGVDERVRQQYPKVYDILDRMGKATNTKFKFVDTIYDPTGQIPGFANGQYDPTTDSIEIALDTFNPFMVVAKHEITHMLEKESPKLHKEYKDYVLSAMKENGTYDVQYERMAELYKSRGLEVDKNAIEDELVADATELFLTDENAINSLVAENKTLGQKILDVLRKLIEKIEDILEVSRFSEGWLNTEQLREAERLWVNALSSVVEAEQKTTKKIDKKQHSLKDDDVISQPYGKDNYIIWAGENNQIPFGDFDTEKEARDFYGKHRNRLSKYRHSSNIDTDIEYAETSKEVAELKKLLDNAEYIESQYAMYERKKSKPVSINDVIKNIKNDRYRREDLESLAEQVSKGNWDDYDDMTDDELSSALIENIESQAKELNVLERQDKRSGFSVRPPRNAKYSKDGEKPIVKKSLKGYNVSEIESTILTNHNEYKNNKEALKLAAEAIKDLQKVKFSISSTGREVDRDRAGIRTIADGISREFINKGYVELKGRKVNSLEELAVIGQIFRDPRFETFRIIYTKNNKIVAHEGISSRIPGLSSAFLNTPKRSEYNNELDYRVARSDFNKTKYDDMKDRMKRLKADGYYLLHNHPSGNPDASTADVYLTKGFMDNVTGFKGHVIINSNKYGWLEMGKLGYTVHVEDMTQQQIELFLKPTIKHPLLNESINGADKAASIAKSLQLSEDKTAIVYTDVKGTIRGIEEIPNGMFNDRISIRGFLRNRGRHFGSGWAFLSTTSQDIFGKSANLVKEKYLMDSILLTGGDNYYSHRSDTGIVQDDDYEWAGIKGENLGNERVNESLKNEVFYTPGKVEVIKNPTDKQLEQLRADFKKEYPSLAKQGEPPTRRTFDVDGNVYYWKSADGLHYTIEYYIDKKYNTQTEQNKNFDIKYDETKFSLKAPVEETKDLIAIHNISEDNLKGTLELGGFPVPSIAITRAEQSHDNFGDISVVFTKDTIDPEFIRKNKVFTQDVYSKRVPAIKNRQTNTQFEKINDIFMPYFEKLEQSIRSYSNKWEDTSIDDAVYELSRQTAVKMAYLDSKGIETKIPYKKKVLNRISEESAKIFWKKHKNVDEVDLHNNRDKWNDAVREVLAQDRKALEEKTGKKYPGEELSERLTFAVYDRTVRDLLKRKNGIAEKEIDIDKISETVNKKVNPKMKDFENWLRDTISPYFGDKYFRDDNERRRDYTLENLTQYMKGDIKNQEKTLVYGLGQVIASTGQELTSIADIKKASTNLTDSETRAKYKAELEAFDENVRSMITKKRINSRESFFDVFEDYYKALTQFLGKKKSAKSALSSNGFRNVTDEMLNQFREVGKRIKETPPEYFEAKPQRAVGFDEVAAMVVPKTTDKELLQQLKDRAIKVVRYDSKIEGDRLKKVNSVKGVKFSLKDSQGRTLTQEQAEYFKDSKVRDENGNLQVVYHGSKNNEPFSVFKKGSGAYGFLWATSLEHEANRYANRVDKGKVYKLYADIKNPKYFKAKRFSDSPENYVQNLKSEYDGAIIEYELPLYWKDYHYETTSPTSDWYRIPIGVNLSELYAKNDGVMRVIAVRNSNQFKETTNKQPSNDLDVRYQLRDDEGNLGYHAGDLGKAESYWNIMSGNRSTGHFGTGTYFVGNKEAINLDGYTNRPQHGVDFSDYNLYKPYNYRHGIRLHDFLKKLNYNLRHLPDAKRNFEDIFEEFHGYKKAADDISYGFWKEDEDGMKKPEFIKAKEKLDKWADENLSYNNIRYEKGSNGYYEELFKLIEEDNEWKHELRRWYEFDLDHSSIDLGISRSKINKLLDEIYNEVKDLDMWSDEVIKADSISTRFMKKLGYDGIDVRGIKGLDNTMYGSVIYDVKEPSIKYQLRDNKSVKDIEKLQNTVTRLKEQFKLTKGVKLDEKAVRRLSKSLLKDYSSKYSSTELETKLYSVYMGMINGDMEYDDAQSIITEVARDIIENASVLSDAMYKQYSALRQTMRDTAISINDRYKGDFDAVGGWNDFRKRNFGRMNITSDGMSIDKLYQELSDSYPELFLEDVANPADQLMLISDVLDGLVPIYENPYNRELNEAVEYLALEIFDGMTSVPEAKPTFADRKKAEKQKAVEKEKDKSKARVEALKNKNVEDIAWLKHQNKEKLAEVLQKEKAKRDEAVVKVKKQYQDKAYKTWWRNKLNENDIKSHYQEMIKELRSRRDEKLEQQKTKYKERISGIYEDRKIRQAKDRIRTMAKKLGKMLRSPTQKQHIPKALDKTIAELLTMLDFTTDRQKETTQIKLRDLRAEFEKLAKVSDEEGLSTTADPYIVEALEMLHNKRIAEMNLQEIELLRDIVGYFENMVRTYNKAFLNGKWVDVVGKSEGIIKDLDTDAPMNESAYGGILYFKDMMNWGMLTPQMFFERMGNTFNSLYDDFRAALDKKINSTKIAQDYMSDLLKNSKDKISQWTGKKAEIKTVKLDSGKTIELTQSQLMSFYLLMKREQARGHIFGLGVKAAPIVAVNNKGMKYVKKQFEPVKITLDDATKMIAMLSKEQRRIADGIGKFMNTYSKQWVNEATLQNYGYELAKEENYFPIKVDRDFLKSDFDNTNLDPTFTSMGFLKATIKGAGNAIILEDVFDVFTEHADKAATYNAFVGVTESTKKIVNYKTQDNSIKQAMNKKFGIQAFNYLKKFMVDLQGGIRTESGSPVVTGLIRKSKRAVLGLNLRTIIQQPTAIVRASALIDIDYLIKGVAMKSDKAEMLEKSPIARWKSWGYFNLDTGRSMKDIILDSVPLLDKQYQGMQIADDITWTKIWNAVKLETEKNEPGLKVGSAEYFDAVNYRFNEIIDRTQVVDTVLHRSDSMRQSDSSWKILTAFMSEPTKSYNLLLNAVEKYNANKSAENKKVLLRTFSAWTATMLVNTLVISMLDMWRRKEDDKETLKDKWIDNILNDVTGYVPIVRDIYSLFEGYSVKRMEYNGIERIVRAINRSKKYIEEMSEDKKHSYPLRLITKNWIESVAYVFGVGAINVSKDLEALLRNYTRWIDDEGVVNDIYEFMFKK